MNRRAGPSRSSRRSSCPIAFGLDLFGDRWSLLVLRDLIFEGKTRFQDLLCSDERIASNVLADRLERLVEAGLVAKQADAADARRYAYAPTGKALDLIPVMLEIVRWSARYDPATGAPPELVKELERDRDEVIRRIRARFERAPRRARTSGGSQALGSKARSRGVASR